ncbi:MAG: metallophosphoesterase [Verrucomicrobiales bacterium]|nr:metallophosphoesterase [Verrucomicrobiales bacterium]
MPHPTRNATSTPCTLELSPGILVDSRLALVHTTESWLAVADLHFGYELTKRHQGGLFPLFGIETITTRLTSLITDYKPSTLILAGDLIDGPGAVTEFANLIATLQSLDPAPEIIALQGNHDRGAVLDVIPFQPEFATPTFRFHHGHQPHRLTARSDARTQVTGHLHPTHTFRDGAGLCLKLPVLVLEQSPAHGQRWILPAFSPWAGGRNWQAYDLPPGTSLVACSPHRVFKIPTP